MKRVLVIVWFSIIFVVVGVALNFTEYKRYEHYWGVIVVRVLAGGTASFLLSGWILGNANTKSPIRAAIAGGSANLIALCICALSVVLRPFPGRSALGFVFVVLLMMEGVPQFFFGAMSGLAIHLLWGGGKILRFDSNDQVQLYMNAQPGVVADRHACSSPYSEEGKEEAKAKAGGKRAGS